MINKVNYKVLDLVSLHPTLFDRFSRYQETNQVWFKENGQYKIKEDHFIEKWNDEKKKVVIRSLQECVRAGGVVLGAFVDGDLIGFASVEGELFGRTKDYLELSYIHVSNEYRNYGIGRTLFELCCQKALALGAKKLYIAAHPSVETQQFYRSMGCTYAVEINQQIFEKEPLDIQLELILHW